MTGTARWPLSSRTALGYFQDFSRPRVVSLQGPFGSPDPLSVWMLPSVILTILDRAMAQLGIRQHATTMWGGTSHLQVMVDN